MITMTSFQERVVLRDWVALNWSGGDIVEIGAFCGASAVAILQGMNAAKRFGTFHVYDTFQIPDDFTLIAAYKAHGVGETFRAEFDDAVYPYRDALVVHSGDAREAFVPESVSLLHFDCAINLGFHKAVCERFFPKLQIGATLIQQDYGYRRAPWIAEYMGRFQKKFKALLQVETSAYYKVVQPLTPEIVRAAFE